MHIISKLPLCLILVLSVDVASAAEPVCTPKQADAAEAAADHLTDWTKVSSYVRRFHVCDDGGMAEASSEAIARLLVDKWQTLPQLAAAVHRQPMLKNFVLSHINSTLDTADVKKIQALARTSCPTSNQALCHSLEGATVEALD